MWVTGLRPPGMRWLMPGIVTRACLIVARSGRTVPPTIPTFRLRASGSDLGDFIGVFALLHVHQLAFARADEATLPRLHPSGPLRLDLRAQLERERAIQQEDVTLPRGRSVDDPEALRIVAGVRRRRHLDRAAHDSEVQ